MSKQEDKAKKAISREGARTHFAKMLVRVEPSKRSQHYKKGVKTNLSRARRRLDKEVCKPEEAPDFRGLLLRMVQRTNPVPGPHYKECRYCGAWLHMTPDPMHRPDCIVIEVRQALGQPDPEKAFRPDAENKWREEEFNARWNLRLKK